MNRVEAIIVGLFLGIMCPFSLCVIGWWSSAALSIYDVLPISESGIATAAFAGLGLGILLDVMGLKSWVARFYEVGLKWLIPVYLLWSVIAVAFLMGLPFGVMVLGIVGGLYIGRRMHHAGVSADILAGSSRHASIFTATVTGAEALFMGFLALRDQYTMTGLQEALGLGQVSGARLVGAGLVGVGCLVLVVVQYWCTKTAAVLAFRMGGDVAK